MEWQQAKAPTAIDVPGLDIYAAWILSEVRSHLRGESASGEAQIPVLIELGSISLQAFAALWQDALIIPSVLLNPPEGLAGSLATPRFVTAVARPAFFAKLRSRESTEFRQSVKSVTLSRAIESQRADDKWRAFQPLQAALRRNGPAARRVVVGIIDDGIAFANRRFRNADGTTRLDSIWLQGAEHADNVPTLFGRGREILEKEIDGALQQCTHAGAVDEDEFYSVLGVVDFASADQKGIYWRRAHGTHVLDIAAGAEPGSEPNWPIVAVELPTAVTADTSGASLAHGAVEGLLYILLRSLDMASRDGTGPLPVVINLSYGFTAGPHDGSHPIEQALTSLVEMWEEVTGARVRLVLPAGNHRQARLHADFGFDAGPVVELPWRIQPGDLTPSHVEIWLPPGATSDAIAVSLVPPIATAPESHEMTDSAASIIELRDGQSILAQIARQNGAGQVARGIILVTVAPTTIPHETPAAKPAPAGLWTIRIRNRTLPKGSTIHAWVQRDDSIAGYRSGGRQSYFDDPRYQRFDDTGRPITGGEHSASTVSRLSTLNAIATASSPAVVVVGGYIGSTARVTPYSGSGPTNGARGGPDALAVSDETLVIAGTRAAGTRSGSVVAMNGTSTAAPVVTRLIAQALQAGGSADASYVRDLARAYSTQIGGVPNSPALYGAGLLPKQRGGGVAG